MNWIRRRVGFSALGATLILAGCIGAMQTQPHGPAGAGGLQPTLEDKDAGLVGLAPGFDLRAYSVIVVDRFPVAASELNDDEDKTMAAAMTPYFQSELVRRLRETGLFARVVNLAETSFTPGSEKTLRLEGAITRFDPGSRALRYIVGFGAGRSKAQAELKFVDPQSGQTVMVTADRRVAAYGVFGGDSEDHLKESFGDIARDLGKFLVRLGKGETSRQGQRSLERDKTIRPPRQSIDSQPAPSVTGPRSLDDEVRDAQRLRCEQAPQLCRR